MTLALPKLTPSLSTESSQIPRKRGVETAGKEGEEGRGARAGLPASRNERVNSVLVSHEEINQTDKKVVVLIFTKYPRLSFS